MKWATREHIHIDRAACAWLIRRHIDPDAEFVFVADPADVPAGATPFDIRGAERPPQRSFADAKSRMSGRPLGG